MTNKQLLMEFINKSGIKIGRLCQDAGFTYTTFSRKINGKNEFTVKQVNAMSKALKLSQKDRDRIFFA